MSSKLLICSEKDISSTNMRDALFGMGKWEDIGSDGTNTFHSFDDKVIMTIPELHIYAENVDKEAEKFGIKFDEVIFMSRHKAASAIPTLTVHPIGNYNNADFGGKSETLVKSSPASMTDALRTLSKMDTEGFQVSFEVTHHGPYLDKPTMFIEIGSDETMWGNIFAAETLAKTILAIKDNDYPNVIGVGGGHYAPRFTEISNAYKVNFGHMLPGYAFSGLDDEKFLSKVKLASDATATKMVYLHKKSLKKSEASRLSELMESNEFEIVTSKDFDAIMN